MVAIIDVQCWCCFGFVRACELRASFACVAVLETSQSGEFEELRLGGRLKSREALARRSVKARSRARGTYYSASSSCVRHDYHSVNNNESTSRIHQPEARNDILHSSHL